MRNLNEISKLAILVQQTGVKLLRVLGALELTAQCDVCINCRHVRCILISELKQTMKMNE